MGKLTLKGDQNITLLQEQKLDFCRVSSFEGF
jgi:hypothetical protein